MTLFDARTDDPRILPAVRLEATVVACLVGDGPGFRTRPVDGLVLDHEGAVGDGHRGMVRAAGGREPWYPRGTLIRSGRQISLVGIEDLADIALRLDVDTIDPAVIGANIVLSGVPRLSFLPAGTRLHAPGGAAIVVEAMNGPCRHAGKALSAAIPGRPDLEFGFVEAARRRRGVVASVERTGSLAVGEVVSVRIPEQWTWTP
jgi:hypothetical protein